MLIVHLFVSYAHVNLCHFFSSSWCQGLAKTSACGSSWTLLYTFLEDKILIYFYCILTNLGAYILHCQITFNI